MESPSAEQLRMCKKLHHYDGSRMNRFRKRKIGSISTLFKSWKRLHNW